MVSADCKPCSVATYWYAHNLQSAKEGIEGFRASGQGCSIGAGNQHFLTKEVLVDQSPTSAPLRSIAEAFANNRCLAALPRKSIRRDGALADLGDGPVR